MIGDGADAAGFVALLRYAVEDVVGEGDAFYSAAGAAVRSRRGFGELRHAPCGVIGVVHRGVGEHGACYPPGAVVFNRAGLAFAIQHAGDAATPVVAVAAGLVDGVGAGAELAGVVVGVTFDWIVVGVGDGGVAVRTREGGAVPVRGSGARCDVKNVLRSDETTVREETV